MTATLPAAPADDSATVSTAGPSVGPAPRSAAGRHLRPVLRLVPDPAALSARVGRLPFTLLVLALLGGGLLLLLLVNTELAQGSFRAHESEARVATLEERAQELQVQVDERETPESLAARAAALGLRPAGVPGFVRVPGGQVLRGPEGDDVPLVPFSTPKGAEDSSAGGVRDSSSADDESSTADDESAAEDGDR